ncbi:hypothetical protein [Actinokineospora globicatena]|uniref:hypothetical protein n=1 Tax=Actinokineospora globicatena TaxID=103729 RepID=UPI0020A5032B|nr:hypothetical protein [Actinokineospora globicatena]GLW78699.1 hypothetical protein Aglo01_31810 [Actinokineospora globicatena]GLW84633.1 hypothetical protein Aglo02_22730 [Actinokineospora globicatena]
MRGFVRAGMGALLVAVLVGCGSTGGADSSEAAVDSYIAALNARDEGALRALGGSEDPETKTGIAERLAEFGGRDVRVTSRELKDYVPGKAVAQVSGTMSGGQPYRERLALYSRDDRWFVDLQPDKAATPGGAIPTLGAHG